MILVRRAAGLLLAVGTVVLTAWWLWPRQVGPPVPTSSAPPASQFQGVRLVDEDSDGTQWTLHAAKGYGWESRGTGKLEDIRVVFSRGGRQIEVSAKKGEISEGETVSLEGGVEAICQGFTANLDRATYYRGKGEIRSDAEVELAGPKLKVVGKGLALDVEGKSARVLSEVRAVVGGRKQ